MQWVPLGEGTVDFKAIVARAAEILPNVHIYCKPITARPPVVIPVYSEEFWTKWFPRGRSRDLGRFLALARKGRPYDKPHIEADLTGAREKYMEASEGAAARSHGAQFGVLQEDARAWRAGAVVGTAAWMLFRRILRGMNGGGVMRETPRRCKAASPPSLFISQYFIRSEPSSSAFSPSLVSHLMTRCGGAFST